MMLRWIHRINERKTRRESQSASENPDSRAKPSLSNAFRFEQFVHDAGSQTIELLKNSWKITSEDNKCGESILIALFGEPRVGQYFGVKSGASEKEIRTMDIFPRHAKRIEGFLDTLVMSLSNPKISKTVITKLCHRIGSIHFLRGVNFDEENWLYFQYIIMQEIITKCDQSGAFGDQELPQVWNGWKDLIALVIEEMRNGYMVEVMNNFSVRRDLELKSFPKMKTTRSMILPNDRDVLDIRMKSSDMSLVKESWNQNPHNENIGLSVLIHMLKAKPEMYAKFGVEEGVSEQALKWEPTILVQGERINALIDLAVHLCDPESKGALEAKCKHVGMVHFKMGVNLNANMWQIMKDVIIDQMCADREKCFAADVQSAWNKLLSFVVCEIEKGFIEVAMPSKKEKVVKMEN